jgi:hypothetical protein
VFEIVLISLFTAVIFSDSNSVFTVPAIFWWLLQISSGDSVGLVLICFSFIFETALGGPLKGPGHLFVSFSTFYKYLTAVSVWFGSNVRESTPFFIKRIANFFLSDQKWETFSFITFFFFFYEEC